jgi:fatty acid desaturase
VAPNPSPVYDSRVESQDERRTKRTIETLRGFALLAVGVIVTIWGATLSGGWAVAFVAMGGVALVGGGGVLFLVRTPRIEDVDRRRALRLWAAGMLVALGIVATIAGAALAVPVWIPLGVVVMLFGGAIAYVVAPRPSHRP